MRKSLMLTVSILLVFVIVNAGQAQISFPNSGTLPSPGSALNSWLADDIAESMYNHLTATDGGSQTWGVTTVDFIQENTGTVIEAFSAPQIGSFPDANFIVRTINLATEEDTVWSYTEWLPMEVTEWGTAVRSSRAGEVLFKYDESTPLYPFPMAFNDEWTTEREGTREFTPQFVENVFDTITYAVDGWGTITYEGNTVDCLRLSFVKRTTTQQVINGTPMPGSTVETEGAEFFGEDFEFLVSVNKSGPSGFESYSASAFGGFVGSATDVSEINPGQLPEGFDLSQNYPNPFNPVTEIEFSLPKSTDVRLTIYNMLGQRVTTLVDQYLDAGFYSVDWDGSNDAGSPVSSGVYFYRLSVGEFSEARKMLLLK